MQPRKYYMVKNAMFNKVDNVKSLRTAVVNFFNKSTLNYLGSFSWLQGTNSF